MASKSGSRDPASKQASSNQAERFKEAARELGADESDDALDRAMDRLDLKAKPKLADDDKSDDGRS